MIAFACKICSKWKRELFLAINEKRDKFLAFGKLVMRKK